MNISSRTPEGTPNECPVCQKALCIEPSVDVGDAPCPHCGSLLWFVTSPMDTRVFDKDDVPPSKRKLIATLLSSKILADSLDKVELAMQLEESGFEISEEELEMMKTTDELVDYILYKLPE